MCFKNVLTMFWFTAPNGHQENPAQRSGLAQHSRGRKYYIKNIVSFILQTKLPKLPKFTSGRQQCFKLGSRTFYCFQEANFVSATYFSCTAKNMNNLCFILGGTMGIGQAPRGGGLASASYGRYWLHVCFVWNSESVWMFIQRTATNTELREWRHSLSLAAWLIINNRKNQTTRQQFGATIEILSAK